MSPGRGEEGRIAISLCSQVYCDPEVQKKTTCIAPETQPGLRRRRNGAENEAVRGLVKFAGLAAVILCVCLAGAAQNQDRDTRGLPGTSATAPAPEARIDINRASVEELMKVPGMTRSWAARIVRFRPYRTKQDLVDYGVVSGQVYIRIKDFVIAHRLAQ
jgi:DNA uptake protein ComE-like DNA-binding protein